MRLAHQLTPTIRGLHQVGRSVLDLVFPPRCAGCDRLGAWLCPACQGTFHRLEPPVCPRCGTPIPSAHDGVPCLDPASPLDCIRSVAYFGGHLRTAIHHFKYEDLRVLAEPLGRLMAEAWGQVGVPSDLVVPVPLHPIRLHQRGYNQSALLARELGRHLQVPVADDAMERTRNTAPQTSLGVEERRANVHQAFSAQRARLAGCRVILVDDVLTSGATLEACAAALRQAGAHSVHGFTLARARAGSENAPRQW
jgi:ComF family protein